MIGYIVFSPTSFLKFIHFSNPEFCYLNCFLMTYVSKASGEISLARTQSERARPKDLIKNRKHFTNGIRDGIRFSPGAPVASCTSPESHLSLKAKLKSQAWKPWFDLSSSWWLLSHWSIQSALGNFAPDRLLHKIFSYFIVCCLSKQLTHYVLWGWGTRSYFFGNPPQISCGIFMTSFNTYRTGYIPG